MAEDKIVRKVNSFNKPVSLMEISTFQLRRFLRKGCNLYVVKVVDLLLNENPKLVRDHPVLNEFMDLFREETCGLPPQREIDFSIEIIHGSTPASKVPYRSCI